MDRRVRYLPAAPVSLLPTDVSALQEAKQEEQQERGRCLKRPTTHAKEAEPHLAGSAADRESKVCLAAAMEHQRSTVRASQEIVEPLGRGVSVMSPGRKRVSVMAGHRGRQESHTVGG